MSLFALVVLECVNLASIARQFSFDIIRSGVITAAVLSLIVALLLLLLSNLEHTRSMRPSVLIGLYFVPTLLFDIARVRTWWIAFDRLPYTVLLTVKTALKFYISGLEAFPKTRWLEDDISRKEVSKEETSSVYSLAFLYWLNPLIYLGSRKILDSDDLYPLDTDLSSKKPLPRFRKLHKTLKNTSSSIKLYLRIVQTTGLSLLTPVPARLFLIGFSFCQPFFIQQLTGFVQRDETHSQDSGVGLIGASILIYSGLTLSTSMYWYSQYRVLTKVRATLGGIIFEKSLQLATIDESVLTLMSMDINRVCGGLHNIHELWANTLEVALAAWLLERQLGAAFVAPIVIVIVCVGLTTGAGRYAGKWQSDWSSKTQNRIKFTSGMITQIKEVKLSGRGEQVANLAQHLRENELDSGARFRLLGVFSTCVAFAPMLLAPVITFAITDIGHPLDTSQVYSSLSYLTLLASPLSQLFQTVPMMLASTASFKRIHDFLSRPSRRIYQVNPPITNKDGVKEVLAFKDAHLGWQESEWTLFDINLTFIESQLSIIAGPVACGKSTLCKGILGEVPFFQGTFRAGEAYSETIGFCDQTIFLTNESIRTNIIGPLPFDSQRYESVIRATLLDVDMGSFKDRDNTHVGSKGMSLSGGQKRRVALARALYLDSNLFILDDALSGLDVETADAVVQRLFGPQGLLRKKTVIWCTHSTRYLSLANQVIVLGADGRVQRCGHPDAQTISLAKKSLSDSIEDDLQTPTPCPPSHPSTTTADITTDETKSLRSRHDKQVYALYLQALGPRVIVLILVTGILFGFSWNFGNIWVGFWSRNTFNRTNSDARAFYLGIYASFQAFGVIALAMYCISTNMVMSRRGGSQLHARAIRHLFSLPLSYFGRVDSGVTTNLFSQDMEMLDGDLTFAISNTLLSGVAAIGQLIIVAVATPYVAIGYPVILGVLYVLQNYYLKTSRQLRLLHLEAKSPL